MLSCKAPTVARELTPAMQRLGQMKVHDAGPSGYATVTEGLTSAMGAKRTCLAALFATREPDCKTRAFAMRAMARCQCSTKLFYKGPDDAHAQAPAVAFRVEV